MRKGTAWVVVALLGAVVHAGYAQSKFSFSLTATPSLTRVVYQDDSNPPVNKRFTQNGFQVGTLLHYHFSDQWSVSSGLWLEWNRVPAVPLAGGLHSSTNHNFQFPLLLNYQTTTRRLAPYLSLGLVLYKEKYGIAKMTYSPTQVYEMGFNVYEPLRPHLLLGAGMKYRLNEHLSLITQPVFTYGAEREKDTRTYQWGLQTQLVCRF